MDLDPDLVRAFAGRVREARSVLFVTGAGISADSGLPTYRGVGGLYDRAVVDEGFPIEVALSGPMLQARPALCWKYIHQIEAACRGAQPNAAHEIIARLQRRFERACVLTQNVDGFHRAAGSDDVIEIHGNIHELHCTSASGGCAWEQQVDDYADLAPELGTPEDPRAPVCPQCGALVRPRVVLFGEMLPELAVARLTAELQRGFDLVVSVGTTSAFPYIAEPVVQARRRGAATVEINPGESEVSAIVDLRIPARARPTFEALWATLEV
jgi:NAD-dependent deacetylase